MTRDSPSIPARAAALGRVKPAESPAAAAPAAAAEAVPPSRTQQPPPGQAPQATPRDAPKAVADSETAGLLALLKCEADARAAPTRAELQFLIVNEARKFTRARQAFLFRDGRRPRLAAISDLAAVDSSAALVGALEAAAPAIAAAHRTPGNVGFDLTPYAAQGGPAIAAYPFRQALWLPFDARPGRTRAKEPSSGLLLTREQPWTEADAALARRLAATFAHALALIDSESRLAAHLPRLSGLDRKWFGAAAAAAVALLFFPVSMTTLAPFEVTPEDPFVVAAPIEAVIEQALVEPNSEIEAGVPLVRFADTHLRNRLEVAEREVLVAEAHMKQATQLGFDQVEGRNAVALAAAEHDLKIAERNAARDMLARTTIVAPKAGVALFHDKGTLAGKPVGLGERIMLLADPAKIELAIDVAASDSLLLKPGARAKIFLDTDPVHPREAVVAHADYQARVLPGDMLAFRVVARLTGDEPLPRLGVRGTAQLYGDRVPFAFYLFRRPVTALRQWLGL